jgi:hypothetical protein
MPFEKQSSGHFGAAWPLIEQPASLLAGVDEHNCVRGLSRSCVPQS